MCVCVQNTKVSQKYMKAKKLKQNATEENLALYLSIYLSILAKKEKYKTKI